MNNVSKKALVCVLFLCVGLPLASSAETFPRKLPKVRLERVLPELKVDRPVWMQEFGGRFFVIEQQGRIVTTPKNGDGKDQQDFLNIVDVNRMWITKKVCSASRSILVSQAIGSSTSTIPSSARDAVSSVSSRPRLMGPWPVAIPNES